MPIPASVDRDLRGSLGQLKGELNRPQVNERPIAVYLDDTLDEDTRDRIVFSAYYSGYVLRRIRLVSAGGVGRTLSGAAYVKIQATVVKDTGSTILGTFDSRTAKISPGDEYLLTHEIGIDGNLDMLLEKGTQIGIRVTQTSVDPDGLNSVSDVTAFLDVIYRGDNG